MEEKVLQGKKNGMLVLFLTIALFLAAGIGLVFRKFDTSVLKKSL